MWCWNSLIESWNMRLWAEWGRRCQEANFDIRRCIIMSGGQAVSGCGCGWDGAMGDIQRRGRQQSDPWIPSPAFYTSSISSIASCSAIGTTLQRARQYSERRHNAIVMCISADVLCQYLTNGFCLSSDDISWASLADTAWQLDCILLCCYVTCHVSHVSLLQDTSPRVPCYVPCSVLRLDITYNVWRYVHHVPRVLCGASPIEVSTKVRKISQ